LFVWSTYKLQEKCDFGKRVLTYFPDFFELSYKNFTLGMIYGL